jgi:uncharacterized metal-binding protein
MPSARTHDLITLGLAAPLAASTYCLTADWKAALLATTGMLFGGLMFGPDLDIQSRQYARWGPLRFLWWPYRVLLPHRSRLSHGIVLGTLIRLLYFILVVWLLLGAALYVAGDSGNSLADAFRQMWEVIWQINRRYLVAALAGLWIGAASHTLADLIGSFLKSLRRLI